MEQILRGVIDAERPTFWLLPVRLDDKGSASLNRVILERIGRGSKAKKWFAASVILELLRLIWSTTGIQPDLEQKKQTHHLRYY